MPLPCRCFAVALPLPCRFLAIAAPLPFLCRINDQSIHWMKNVYVSVVIRNTLCMPHENTYIPISNSCMYLKLFPPLWKLRYFNRMSDLWNVYLYNVDLRVTGNNRNVNSYSNPRLCRYISQCWIPVKSEWTIDSVDVEADFIHVEVQCTAYRLDVWKPSRGRDPTSFNYPSEGAATPRVEGPQPAQHGRLRSVR